MRKPLAVLALFLLFGCDERPTPKPMASAAPVAQRPVTLSCDATLPEGWTRVAKPMPEHIAEFSTMPAGTRALSTVMLEEHDGELDDAVDAEKRRTEAAWGDRHDFALIAEQPLSASGHDGTLLVYRWRPGPTSPDWIHYRALLPFEERVVLGLAETIAGGQRGRDEDAIVKILSSLSCKPR